MLSSTKNVLKPFQLQHLVADDICVQATEMFLRERGSRATGGYVGTAHQRLGSENSYQKKAEQLMSDENCFKIVLVSALRPCDFTHCSGAMSNCLVLEPKIRKLQVLPRAASVT